MIARPVGNQAVKDWARRLGVAAKDLIALEYDSDPFYVGKPSDEQKATWFKRTWNRLGYTSVVHLRRVFYRLLSLEGMTTHDGQPFVNTRKCLEGLQHRGPEGSGTGSGGSRQLRGPTQRRGPHPCHQAGGTTDPKGVRESG